MSANSLCLQILYSSFFRLCYDDCVQADAVFRLEAERGRSGGRTRAERTQDAGALEAGRGQTRDLVISWQYCIQWAIAY